MGRLGVAPPTPGRPFHLSLTLTHACNLACGYCYMGEHHAATMARETAERAVRQAFEISPLVQVSFFGGEPLLEWGLLRQLTVFAMGEAQARKGTALFQVTTNATLFDAEKAAFLREHGFSVAVSLDGDEAVHDQGRPNSGGGSSFGRVIAGLVALCEASVPYQLVCVVTPENVGDLCASVRFLETLSPRRIHINPAFERDWSEEDLAVWRQQLEELCADWEARFLAGRPPPLPLFESKLAAAARGARGVDCSAGRWSVAVAPSGRLYPCDRLVADDRDPTWSIGHLDSGIAARGSIPHGHGNEECEQCAERFRCAASCACASIAETGLSDHAGGVSCWLEQTVAELADAAGFRLIAKGHDSFLRAAYGDAISDTLRSSEGAEMLLGRLAQTPVTSASALPSPRRLPVLR